MILDVPRFWLVILKTAKSWQVLGYVDSQRQQTTAKSKGQVNQDIEMA